MPVPVLALTLRERQHLALPSAAVFPSTGSISQKWEASPWKQTQLKGRLGSVEDTLHLQQVFNSQVSPALAL